VILVDRHASEGVDTKAIKTSYSPTAGTAFISFENVKVPIENTLGEEGKGIFVILSNFNHERFVMCGASAISQRVIVEECMKYVAIYCYRPTLLFLVFGAQMDKPAESVWKTTVITSGYSE
jgi:alkylation response protein AidB-like acyl-CoA dehydrogenase